MRTYGSAQSVIFDRKGNVCFCFYGTGSIVSQVGIVVGVDASSDDEPAIADSKSVDVLLYGEKLSGNSDFIVWRLGQVAREVERDVGYGGLVCLPASPTGKAEYKKQDFMPLVLLLHLSWL